jgi:hypothetical protein
VAHCTTYSFGSLSTSVANFSRKGALMRMSIRAAVAAALVVALPVVFAPHAAAATAEMRGCSVQVNNPHASSHNPGRINTEFRVFACDTTKTMLIERKFRYYSGSHGFGEFGYTYVGRPTVRPGESASRFYSVPCRVGEVYTATMTGSFSTDGYSRIISESNTFTCR